MKTVKILTGFFFGFAMISLFMAINNMPTFRSSTPEESQLALISGILFLFFISLSILMKWIQEKNRKKI